MVMMKNLFRRDRSIAAVHPRVTPDPQRAAELDRRFIELAYNPEVGFHRDRRQERAPQYTSRKRK